MRNQLSLSNNQLTEFDSLNCKLREELEQAKVLLEQHVNDLEHSKTQEEQFRHQWNQQIADKEAQILELQDKLDSVLQPRMSSARSRDELETISDNENGGLVAITKQIQHVVQSMMGCANCSQNDPLKQLSAAVQDLENLTSVFYSGSQSSSFKKLNSLRRLDLLRYESEELLTKSTMALNNLNNSVGDLIEEEDEDRLSGASSYHSSTSLNDACEDHQAILAKSLEELQRKLSRMEQELIIVGEESKELQNRICQREMDLNQKDKEMKNLFGVVEHMRQLNLRTVEHLEKQKLRNTALSSQLDQSQIQLSQFTDKCVSKDLLIRKIVDLATQQSMIGSEFSVASLVRSLRETTVKPSFVRKSSIDFNLETLCQYLESSANEIIRKKQDQEQQQQQQGEEAMVSLTYSNKINPTLMPPQNFRITRRVGSDSLLVAWTPPNDTEVSGYFIYVNEQLHQKVRSAARTKALLHGLNLRVSFELSIHSIGCHGATVSTCETTTYNQDMVLKPPVVPNSNSNCSSKN